MSSASTGRARGFVALGLFVVLILGLVLSGVLGYRHSHFTDEPLSLTNSGRPVPDQSDEHQAIAVAEQFALRVDSLDTTKLDEYAKSVSELLTTKYKADFSEGVALLRQISGQAPSQSKGAILVSGVTTQDGDSATVLVLHVKETAAAGGNRIEHLRWSVSLRKVDGSWLVDDFTDFKRDS